MQKLIVLALALAVSVTVAAAGVEPETAAAFQRYARLTEERIDREVATETEFLWIDTLPAGRRSEFQKGLKQGGVVIESLKTLDGGKPIEAPGGLIHHWIGVVFVPGVTVKEAVALMQQYDQHSRYFSPAIAASKTLAHDGNRFKVALRFHVKKIITVTMDTENQAEFFHPRPDRARKRG
jgi:hypothetical protein